MRICLAGVVVLGFAGAWCQGAWCQGAGGQGTGSQGAREAATGPGAVVSGSVTFADTDGPARFSKVLLKSTVPGDGTGFFADLMKETNGEGGGKRGADKKPMTAEQKEQMAGAAKVFAQLGDMLESTTVAGDGTYVLSGVKPGTYYIHAFAKGYIDPLAQFSADDFTSTDPAMRKRIAAVATMITVTGADGAHANLRLERGGSISGRVLYDDGTPAVGWTVKTVRPLVPGEENPFASMGLDASDMDLSRAQEASITDDTGSYRIAGLATGDYVVQGRLTTGAVGRASATDSGATAIRGFGKMMGLKLTVYSGNTERQSDAKAVSVKAGQNVSGYDLTLPLRTLHALGGTVRAKTDGHAVNAGSVMLSTTGADGKEDPSMHLVAPVQDDGTFRFDYVQGPATYLLKVTGALDQTVTGTTKVLGQTVQEKKTVHSYGPGSATVMLGDSDTTDVGITVTEVAK